MISNRFAVAPYNFSSATKSILLYILFVFRRLLDFNWEWGLYSEEWDPGVEISSVKCEGGNKDAALDPESWCAGCVLTQVCQVGVGQWGSKQLGAKGKEDPQAYYN